MDAIGHSITAGPLPKFEEIPPHILRQFEQQSIRTPRLYAHPIGFVRKFFWARLHRIQRDIWSTVKTFDVVIDFGCGGGVFLPTLCRMFKQVQGIDIEAQEAHAVADLYRLGNLRLLNVDVYQTDAETVEKADAIVAADVLEHFKDLGPPVERLVRWLKDDGHLFTSGPTENFFTWAGRRLGGMEKPWDHYHTGFQVEDYLAQNGFLKISSCSVRSWMPMYVVSVWKKRPGQADKPRLP